MNIPALKLNEAVIERWKLFDAVSNVKRTMFSDGKGGLYYQQTPIAAVITYEESKVFFVTCLPLDPHVEANVKKLLASLKDEEVYRLDTIPAKALHESTDKFMQEVRWKALHEFRRIVQEMNTRNLQEGNRTLARYQERLLWRKAIIDEFGTVSERKEMEDYHQALQEKYRLNIQP